MPVLQLNDQQFPLQAGTTRVGVGGEADVSLPADPGLGIQALIERQGAGPMTIRRAAASASVRVNGVLLGAEPTPLMHGDKVEIGGVELRFADDAKGGATQFVSASDIAAMAGARRGGAARPTAASGGRLVSLVDGKEYTVSSKGLVFGREASCDVVVAQNDVSRRHAEIAPDDQGYVVRDTSANGVFVNGERVQGSHRLARSDVVRIGSEEFRFYADVLAAGPTPAVSHPAAIAPVAAAVSPREPEAARLAMMSAPTAPAQAAYEDPRPVLATLELRNEGPMKGTQFPVRSPLAHVGRGAHNDVRLIDESVSETHAKLQRRDDGWYVVDMGSTNGTYVGGVRITAEQRLDGSPDLRFGGMKLRFTAAAAAEADGASHVEAKGTRAIASVERPRKAVAPAAPAAAEAATGATRSGPPVILWILLAVVAAAVYFVFQGRA